MEFSESQKTFCCSATSGNYVYITGQPPTDKEVPAENGGDHWQRRADGLKLLAKLSKLMKSYPEAGYSGQLTRDNPNIPAGYTYLGQLIAHDMTFEPSALPTQHLSIGGLRNIRTSVLDLDCIYGGGPKSSPHLYRRSGPKKKGSSKTHFRLGAVIKKDGVMDWGLQEDLPRILVNSSDNNFGQDERIDEGRLYYEPLLADIRNDDNLILAQLVVLFCKFHNRIVDILKEKYDWEDEAAYFEAARYIVVSTYQDIVAYDFLKRLLDPGIYWCYKQKRDLSSFGFMKEVVHKHGQFLIPVEFSVAAFRTGHAMIREIYHFERRRSLSAKLPAVSETPSSSIEKLMEFHGEPPAPKGDFKVPITDRWIIEWSDFFWDDEKADASLLENRNKSFRLTPKANLRLFSNTHMEPLDQHNPNEDDPESLGGLTYRDLARSFDLGLPSGQTLALSFSIEEISNARLRERLEGGDLTAEEIERLSQNTPLFFYLLCEAEIEHQGERLGKLGSAITAEVIFCALSSELNGSKQNKSKFKDLPFLAFSDYGKAPKTMRQLIEFVEM